MAEVRQAGARAGAGRRRRRPRAARGRHQPAAGGDRRGGAAVRRRRRGRDRPRGASWSARGSATTRPTSCAACGASSRPRCARCCPAPARRRSTGTTSCLRNARGAPCGHGHRHRIDRRDLRRRQARLARRWPALGVGVKDEALEAIAAALIERDRADPRGQRARPGGGREANGLSAALLDRLALDPGAHRRDGGRRAQDRRAARPGGRGDRRLDAAQRPADASRCASRWA